MTGLGVVGGVYHVIQDTECLMCYIVQKFYFIMELVSVFGYYASSVNLQLTGFWKTVKPLVMPLVITCRHRNWGAGGLQPPIYFTGVYSYQRLISN